MCEAVELSEHRQAFISLHSQGLSPDRTLSTPHHVKKQPRTMSNDPRPTPSDEEVAALLDCFRYGDLEQDDLGDIQRFAEHYGDRWLAEARDDRGNTPLHMAGGNGHLGESDKSA